MPERVAMDAVAPPERALIARGAEFEGLLVLHGPARIEGGVRGEIVGSSLWIGPAAAVDARIEVERLIVSGALAGSARVQGRLELRSTARVTAQIEAGSLVLEEGSLLEGHCIAGVPPRP
jgi:cytoskeletal protein CcmA (bactofilin family)